MEKLGVYSNGGDKNTRGEKYEPGRTHSARQFTWRNKSSSIREVLTSEFLKLIFVRIVLWWSGWTGRALFPRGAFGASSDPCINFLNEYNCNQITGVIAFCLRPYFNLGRWGFFIWRDFIKTLSGKKSGALGVVRDRKGDMHIYKDSADFFISCYVTCRNYYFLKDMDLKFKRNQFFFSCIGI